MRMDALRIFVVCVNASFWFLLVPGRAGAG